MGEGEGLAVYLGIVVEVKVEDLGGIFVGGELSARLEVEGFVDIAVDGFGELVGLGEVAIHLGIGII